MPLVIVAEDILAPETWERNECKDLLEFLTGRWEQWPSTARLYHDTVAMDHDVTPTCIEDIQRLKEMDGPFWVIIYPGVQIFGAIVYLVIAVAMMVISYILAPKPPEAKNEVAQSPNNGLSDRQNQARINGRIPDIYGTVRSTPDLVMNPYKVYENHQEIEYALMCVGRGYYEIDPDFIYDGDTQCKNISGVSVEVYDPNTSPNNSLPNIQIGSDIAENLWIATKSNSVNGQILRPTNAKQVNGDEPLWHTPGWTSYTPIRFVYPNEIQIDPNDNSIDFTDYFTESDPLNITGATFDSTASDYTATATYDTGTGNGTITFTGFDPSTRWSASDTLDIDNGNWTYGADPPVAIDLTGYGYTVASVTSTTVVLDSPETIVAAWTSLAGYTTDSTTITLSDSSTTMDLNGDYTIVSVSTRTIILDDPSSINSDWDMLEGSPSEYIYPTLLASGYRWVGPFDFETYHNVEEIWCNFVAQNGLYKTDGKEDERLDEYVRMEVWELDEDWNPVGSSFYVDPLVEGSASFHGTRAKTGKIRPNWTSGSTKRFRIRACRTQETDDSYSGQVVDEIKWQACYAATQINDPHFGWCTTAFVRTPATDGALAVKQRKFNLVVQRKVKTRASGFEVYSGTNRADEIISSICWDERIGRRTSSEVDIDSIYDTIHDVEVYFGTDKAIEFNYTFDNADMSFQDHIATVASAVYCQAYRRGNQIKLLPEIATDDSSIIFNHRNKLPGTETRSVVFGVYNDNDGVQIDYVDSEDDSIVTYYIPNDMSAASPKTIDIVGIRNKIQAYWHAWREWNKLQYQNTVTEFEATQEAYLLPLKERVLVADNTRTGTQDGEVVEQDGLHLTLSQPVSFVVGAAYTIFLQMPDGTVESKTITAGSATNQVVLSSAPSQSLVTDPSMYARTTYIIVSDQDARGNAAFLVAEKEPQSRWTCKLKCVNYDSRYYQNDSDYLNSIIDEEGNAI